MSAPIAATAQSHGRRASRARPSEATDGSTKFIYLLWFIILCDPQWWIASFGLTPILKLPTVLFSLALVIICIKPPRAWFQTLLVFIIYTLFNSYLFAYNRGASFVVAKLLVGYYVLAITTLALLRNVRVAVPIVSGVLLWQYAYWAVLGAKNGLVAWHPNLGNYDALGPLMAIGIGVAYNYGLATSNKRERWLSYATALACVVTLVSSYARGAVLGAVAVVGWVWLRSRHKKKVTLVLCGGLLLAGAAGAFYSGSDRGDANSNFFAEMSTIGSGDDTQNDRAAIWALARQVFMENPLFGVGAENFGAYAAETFIAGKIGGSSAATNAAMKYYDDNPARLYGKQLHNAYFQLLSEYGIVGTGIFLWMLVDFFRRNRQLRNKENMQRWKTQSGGRLDLFYLSYSLEVGMVGFLAASLFYNQLFEAHWFYSLTIVNTLLLYLSQAAPQTSGRGGAYRSHAS